MTTFYDEISSLQDRIVSINNNVSRISELHKKSLNSLDNASQEESALLDSLMEETRSIMNDVKGRIQALEANKGVGTEGRVRRDQTGAVKARFVEAAQGYQKVEADYRLRYRQQMERQFRIVKPDATSDEIETAMSNQRGSQIFEQALLDSNRYGESRAAYREAQQRHEDIQKIEQTLAELAQLFSDMAIIVNEADDQVDTLERNAGEAEKNVEAGLDQTIKATDSARRARKGRIICFWITVLICIAIALAVGLPIGLKHLNNK